MKPLSLIAAGVLVLLANAFALAHAARNRSGEPEAEIVLTERELTYWSDPDDSGVALTLQWIDPGGPRYSTALKPEELEARNWLGKEKLTELGFDCRVGASDRDAYSFYNRQAARTAFVALEYDGPGWQSWIELSERMRKAEQVDDQRIMGTRLVAVDAAPDAASLRARHPDRSRVLVVPAVIRISVSSVYRPQQPAVLMGYIQEIPSVIHVPQPYSAGFRANPRPTMYRVRLRYGRFFEPWVAGVEFSPR